MNMEKELDLVNESISTQFQNSVKFMQQLISLSKESSYKEFIDVFKYINSVFFACDEAGNILYLNNRAKVLFGQAVFLSDLFIASHNKKENELLFSKITEKLLQNTEYLFEIKVFDRKKNVQPFLVALIKQEFRNKHYIFGFMDSTFNKHKQSDILSWCNEQNSNKNRAVLKELFKTLNDSLRTHVEDLSEYVSRFLDSALFDSNIENCKSNISNAISFTKLLETDLKNYTDIKSVLLNTHITSKRTTSAEIVFETVTRNICKKYSLPITALKSSVDDEIPQYLLIDHGNACKIIEKILEGRIDQHNAEQISLEATLAEKTESTVSVSFSVYNIKLDKETADIITNDYYGDKLKQLKLIESGNFGLYLAKILSDYIQTSSLYAEKLKDDLYKLSFTLHSSIMTVDNTNQKGNSLSGVKVLSADDSVIMQKIISNAIESEGGFVAIATNGEEAISLYKEIAFDIILMDIEMPVMGGIEATTKLNELKDQFAQNTPIIAVTVESPKITVDQFIKHGITDVLIKPFSVDELIDRIIKHLPERHLHFEKHFVNESKRSSYMLDSISGIDHIKGLERLQGDEKLYYKLLGNFKESYLNLPADINLLLKNGEIHALLDLLHVIKGVSSNLELTQIYENTVELYDALEGNLEESIVKEKIAGLKNSLNKFINSYNVIYTANSLKEGSFSKLDLLHVMSLISELKNHIIDNPDLGLAFEICNELSEFMKSTPFNENFEKIKSHIDKLQLKEASKLLSAFEHDFAGGNKNEK